MDGMAVELLQFIQALRLPLRFYLMAKEKLPCAGI